MPYTPYHFGPSGFIALALRKWLDVPVFVLVNIVVDVEVLFADKWPVHRYFHTLLIGAVVGAIFAIAAYPLRHLFKRFMQLIRLPYKTGLAKMLASSVLGVWLHVFLDAIWHYDVRIFWPSRARPLYRLLTQPQVLLVCKLSFIGLVVLYIIAARTFRKPMAAKAEAKADQKEQEK